jgi:nucleotide-binding universal stress UspA family protein
VINPWGRSFDGTGAARGSLRQLLAEHAVFVERRGLHGGFRGLVLGSVSQHVAGYAKCPVAVVR